MKSKKMFSLILVMLMVLSLAAGCGDNSEKPPVATQGGTQTTAPAGEQTTVPTQSEKPSATEPTEQTQVAFKYPDAVVKLPTELPEAGGIPEKLTLTLLTTKAANNIGIWDGGVVCRTDDTYGFISKDGSYDSGSRFAYCTGKKMYFYVADEIPEIMEKVTDMNCFGLVDGQGNELIPQQYAAIEVLNARFAKACEVTELAESKDDALIYTSDKMFSFSPSDDDTFYKGNWYIYDLATGEKVPGLAGTKPYYSSASGNIVTYMGDDKKYHDVFASGDPLPEGADLFSSSEYGLYTVETDSKGTVYDSLGNCLFTYDPEGFEPSGEVDGYIYGSKWDDEANTTKYILMDFTGKVLTAEFTDLPSVQGAFLQIHQKDEESGDYINKYFDFQGNLLFTEKEYTDVIFNKFDGTVILVNETEVKLLDKNLNLLFSCAYDESIRWSDYEQLCRKVDDGRAFFSHKTGDMSVAGYAISYGLVHADAYTEDEKLVDLYSGEILMAGGRRWYSSYARNSQIVYCENADGLYEIYLVSGE